MKIIESNYIQNLPFDKADNGNYIILPKSRNYSGVDAVNKRRFPNGYIYFIRLTGTDYYKLGVSQNVKRRLQDINAATPFDLEILSLHYFNDVYDVEAEYKTKLSEFVQKGEWLRITDIETAKNIMIELHNLEVTTKS